MDREKRLELIVMVLSLFLITVSVALLAAYWPIKAARAVEKLKVIEVGRATPYMGVGFAVYCFGQRVIIYSSTGRIYSERDPTACP